MEQRKPLMVKDFQLISINRVLSLEVWDDFTSVCIHCQRTAASHRCVGITLKLNSGNIGLFWLDQNDPGACTLRGKPHYGSLFVLCETYNAGWAWLNETGMPHPPVQRVKSDQSPFVVRYLSLDITLDEASHTEWHCTNTLQEVSRITEKWFEINLKKKKIHVSSRGSGLFMLSWLNCRAKTSWIYRYGCCQKTGNGEMLLKIRVREAEHTGIKDI